MGVSEHTGGLYAVFAGDTRRFARAGQPFARDHSGQFVVLLNPLIQLKKIWIRTFISECAAIPSGLVFEGCRCSEAVRRQCFAGASGAPDPGNRGELRRAGQGQPANAARGHQAADLVFGGGDDWPSRQAAKAHREASR